MSDMCELCGVENVHEQSSHFYDVSTNEVSLEIAFEESLTDERIFDYQCPG